MNFRKIKDCDGTISNKNTLMVVTFLIVVVDFLTEYLHVYFYKRRKKKKKKTPNLIFHFVHVCYGIYGVRWVRGGGTKGSYSYSKTLIMGS
jgi:hypothetical protein